MIRVRGLAESRAMQQASHVRTRWAACLGCSDPTVLYPAFRIQSKLKKLLLTPQEWDAMAVQREVVTEYQVRRM